MKSENQIKLEELYKDLNLCEKRVLAAANQLRTELSGDRKVILEENYNQLLNTYREIELQIKKVKANLADGWQEFLYHLDYDKADLALAHVIQHLRQQPTCIFLLLKESRRMMGRYCVDRMEREWLPKIHRRIHSRTFSLEQFNAEEIIREIAKVAAPDRPSISTSDTEEVLKKLFNSYSNGILFMRIEFDDDLKSNPEGIFTHLRDEYFRYFQRFYSSGDSDIGPDRIVIMFISKNDIDAKYLDKSVFCEWDETCSAWGDFDPSKILIIPTEIWNDQVVEQWIGGKSGIELSRADRVKMSRDIVNSAGTGLPIDVDRALQRVIFEHFTINPATI